MSDRKTKLGWLRDAEAKGIVADSRDVRLALMARVHANDITLEQAQAELRSIKRRAKANGKLTSSKAYNGWLKP